MKNKKLPVISILIYSLGLTIGLLFNILSVWADFEASIFDASLSSGENFPNFRCPIMISKDEIGVISGDAVNPLDRKMTLTIRSHSTDGAVTLLNETHDKFTLGIGEIKEMEWTVAPDDAVWGNFILFRVYQFSSYPVPAKSSACGVLVANVAGISGNVLVWLLIFISVAGMGTGIWLWLRSHKPLTSQPRDVAVALSAMSIVIVVGNIFSLLGAWLAGVLMLLLAILMLIAIAAFFASSNRRMVA